MTSRNLSVRLDVVDGGKVKAELREVGESGARSLKPIEDASRPTSRALLAVDGTAREIRGSVDGLTGRLGPLGAGLAALGPLGAAAGVALAGVGMVLASGAQEAGEADRSYRRLEAVLKATGFAAGLAGRQIASFAEDMERTTLVTAETVQDAASVLATFHSVAGDTFTRANRLHPRHPPGPGPLDRLRPGPEGLRDPAGQGAGGADRGHLRSQAGRCIVHIQSARAGRTRLGGRDRERHGLRHALTGVPSKACVHHLGLGVDDPALHVFPPGVVAAAESFGFPPAVCAAAASFGNALKAR